jgi:hypothetical protein
MERTTETQRDQETPNAQREYERNEAQCREWRRRQAKFGATPITSAQRRAA